jgi:C-terminal processing protease CtpA/Prc
MIVDEVQTESACDDVLGSVTAAFRDGHVSLVGSDGRVFSRNDHGTKRAAMMTPHLDLRTEAAILTIPSFRAAEGEALADIFERSKGEILSRRRLVLDLRGNGGGNDSSYAPLLPLLYDSPIHVVGTNIRVSREVIDSWERLRADTNPSDASTMTLIEQVLTKMRASKDEWVPIADEEVTFPDILERPSEVIVIVDRRCASTCEEFLLAATQSKKVSVVGTRTAGVLDYANVRRFPLPSGLRRVGLATSRSRRLPANPVDPDGIRPVIPIDEDLVASGSAWEISENAAAVRGEQ